MDPTLDPKLAQALQQSPNYLNPQYMTPEQAANLRATALQLIQQQPEAKSWAGVLGSIANAWGASRLRDSAAQGDRFALQAGANRFNQPGGGAAGGMLASSPPVMGGGALPSSAGAVDPKGLVSRYSQTPLGPTGAAGLVGGFGAESSFKPGAIGDNGASIGVAQWQGDRRQNLIAYAQKHGASPSDPSVQKQFPLVEMGLAGDRSDPGFGTERAAGQALMAARTPQQATAAALMYERPGGYTPEHPENSNGYARRLALAGALMGGGAAPGGNPQIAGNGPMAYAGPSGGPAGMPPIGPGSGKPISAGSMPQASPGPAQMAQNAPQGSPLSGMGSAQIGAIMVDPRIPDHIKARVMEGQIPQALGTPGGGTVMQAPLQPVKPQQVSQGILPSTIGAGPASVPTFTAAGPQGVGSTSLAVPGGGGEAGGGNPLAAIAAIVKSAQDMESQGKELGADTEAIGQYKTEGSNATAKLGQISSFRALGEGIESGVGAQVKNWAAQYGFDLDSQAGRLQAYKLMAQTLLPPDASQGIREQIPALSASPEGRKIIADYLEGNYQYMKKRGDIASDRTLGDPSSRRAAIQKIPAPQSFSAAPQGMGATHSGAAAPAAPSSAPRADDPITKAREAIARGAPREAVIDRLKKAGIDPSGL